MSKTYTVRLDENQIETLEKISKKTNIPIEKLLHQAVNLFLEQQLEFLKQVDKYLEEDKEAMQRLAEL